MEPDDAVLPRGALREFARSLFAAIGARGLRCLAVFAISATLALAWNAVRFAQAAPPAARVAVWICDRDADTVYGLDRDLLAVNSVPIRAPIEVEARSDGGAWIVSATQSDPLGRHELLRLSFDGTILSSAQLGPLLDLDCDDLGRAIVVDLATPGARVRVFDAGAVEVWSRPWNGAMCAAAAAGRCLVGTASGELDLFDLASPNAAPLRANWGGTIGDVAPGPTPGSWWALDSNGTCRLALLDAQLNVLWSRNVGLHALHLAAVAGAERVWIADATQPHVRRFGPAGVLELDRPDMNLAGLDRGCSAPQGSVLFPAPGALLRLDAGGQNAPGQAGFDFLVDASAVRE